jgi:two-component system NarL family sensor kinase
MKFFHLIGICLLASLPVKGSDSLNPDTNRINEIMSVSLTLLNSDPDSAYKLAEEGYKLSQEAGYERGIAKAFMRFGKVMEVRGKINEALYYYRSALSIREKLQDDLMASGSGQSLSYVYVSQGKKDSAFYYLFYALRLANKANDSAEIASVFIELGNLYSMYGEPGKSFTCLKNGLKIFSGLNDTMNLIRAYSGLGSHYYQLKEYRSALPYFLRSVYLSERSGNLVSLGASMHNTALCYDVLSEFVNARYYYLNALKYFNENGMEPDVAMIYYNLGNMYKNMHHSDSVIWFTRKSLELSQRLGIPGTVMICYKQLANTWADKGNYLKAYDYHVQYTELSDSLLNNEKVKQIAEMQTQYDTEIKEREIVLLSEQNRTRVAQRNFFIAGSIVLFLCISIMSIVYINRQRIAKKNELISRQQIDELLKGQELKTYNAMIEGQEEERKRIATDLHDRLGSMLSTVKLLFSSLDTKIDKAQEHNQQQFDKAGSLLDEAVVEVRRISHNLSTGMVMSFGLVPALQELCESIDNSKLIRCRLLVYGMTDRLEQQTEIGLYRMIQEVFSNILKHAKARQVTVQINRVADSLNITIEDDGIGFDSEEKRISGGMGLKNLETRAAQLNGVYHIDSQPGRGTISIIEIPLTTTTV